MKKNEKTKKLCECPYCDVPETASFPFCAGTETKLKFCSECGCSIPRVAKRCPRCGANVEATSIYKGDLRKRRLQ